MTTSDPGPITLGLRIKGFNGKGERQRLRFVAGDEIDVSTKDLPELGAVVKFQHHGIDSRSGYPHVRLVVNLQAVNPLIEDGLRVRRRAARIRRWLGLE